MSLTSTEVNGLQWRKARRSVGNGACVEVVLVKEQILIRDSQDLNGPIIRYPISSWRGFLGDIRKGRFNPDYL
jgi:hypothetical protein